MKRILSSALLFCALIAISLSAAYSDPQSGATDASKLTLKERWMRVPAELNLTPTQTKEFHEYAADLHRGIKQAHREMTEKLKKVLSSDQMEGLREWGENYRHQREETSVHPDTEMNKSLDLASQQLNLTPDQEQQFKTITLEYHTKKHHLFERFNSKLNRILTEAQRTKLEEIREEL